MINVLPELDFLEAHWGLCVLLVPLICIFISYNSRYISHMEFTAQVIGLKTNLDVELNASRKKDGRSQIACPELINHHR